MNTDQLAEKLGRYIIVSNYEAYSIIEKLIRDAAQAERDLMYQEEHKFRLGRK